MCFLSKSVECAMDNTARRKVCRKIHRPWAYFIHMNGAYTADNLSWFYLHGVDKEIFSFPEMGLKQSPDHIACPG